MITETPDPRTTYINNPDCSDQVDEVWEKALYLWARYHSHTESFDRTCCTGWKHGQAFPVNPEQRMESSRNAERQRELLKRDSGNISAEMLREANRVVLKWGLEVQEAFCNDWEWRRMI
jgi:hypothetical protein